MKIDNIKNSTISYKGFFPTLREQTQERENPYALRDDLIKPLPPQGHLVKTNLFNAPKHLVDGWAYDIKSLKKGFNGTANDHELGKLNSIGLVTGGTALAAYLATRKQVSSSKAMEFVGIGSFLASMAIWPVIAIQIPTKLIHGFNVRQHYKDSMDREKLFFNDPQYLPWDLYSDEQINKIGNYMGVPQDMNNRRDYIQNKMKKIATQDNTLWMLSAGFAVPIMSALICNQAEQPVKNLCAYFKTEENKKILSKALDAKYDAEGSDMYKRLESLLELNNGKPVSESVIAEITDIIGYDSNPIVNQKLHAELAGKLRSSHSVLNPEDGEKILTILEKNLSKKIDNREAVSVLVPRLEELSDWLDDGGFINKELGKGDFVKLNALLSQKLLEKLSIFNNGVVDGEKIPADTVLEALNNKINAKSAVNKFHATRPAMVLNEQTQEMLRSLVKELVSVDHKANIVKDYIFKELSAAPETTLANVANKINEDIFKALDIPWKEMDKARSSRDLMNNLLRSNMDRIAANKDQYESVMGQLAGIAKRMNQFDKVVSKHGNQTFFEQTIGRVLNPTAEALEKLGFVDTAESLAALRPDSEKGVLKAFASNRLLSIKTGIFRLINNLDMHRRIALMENVGAITGTELSREIKEEIVELSKRTQVYAHRSDFANKFFFKGNPHPDYSDFSDIEIKDGKVVNRYYKAGTASYRDVSADPTLYRGVMNLMYDGNMLEQSNNILGEKLAGEISQYRHDCLMYFGDEWNFTKPESYISDIVEAGVCEKGKQNYFKPAYHRSTNKYKYIMTGISMDDMAMRFAKQKHNAKAWMKLFGGMGAGIMGATIAVQFFFGHTPKPLEQVKHDK